jgi:hypothetical protein
MTVQLTTAVASRDRTAPAEARHRHDSACFWDVDECRWQCFRSCRADQRMLPRPRSG